LGAQFADTDDGGAQSGDAVEQDKEPAEELTMCLETARQPITGK
jgi:hypothetical protein